MKIDLYLSGAVFIHAHRPSARFFLPAALVVHEGTGKAPDTHQLFTLVFEINFSSAASEEFKWLTFFPQIYSKANILMGI